MLTSYWQLHYVVIDLKPEHFRHHIRPLLYLGKHAGIFSFDDFEYKEIAIEDGMSWLSRAPERVQARLLQLDIYIFIYTVIYIYIYMCVYVCISIYIYLSIYLSISICICIGMSWPSRAPEL